MITRIIPTRMGTSDNYTVDGDLFRDHPHAYGDKAYCFVPILRMLGSSPRVWGQESSTAQRVTIHRIIPTRMGTR